MTETILQTHPEYVFRNIKGKPLVIGATVKQGALSVNDCVFMPCKDKYQYIGIVTNIQLDHVDLERVDQKTWTLDKHYLSEMPLQIAITIQPHDNEYQYNFDNNERLVVN
jgi:hypothetical protein